LIRHSPGVVYKNETVHDPQPALLDPENLAVVITAQVLMLPAPLQRFGGGRLDADENIEAALAAIET
jgi:hypothetical protein